MSLYKGSDRQLHKNLMRENSMGYSWDQITQAFPCREEIMQPHLGLLLYNLILGYSRGGIMHVTLA